MAEVTLARQSELRQLPVRLCDVRADVRLHAAQRVARREPGWAAAVLAAALEPSATIYWIHESAWPIYLSVVAA